MAPRLASGSSAFSAFSNYQGLPVLAPAAGAGSHLARSLPKPSLFSMDSLAPLPYSTGPAAGAVAAVPRSPPLPGPEQQGASASGLPPRGVGHRRSRSDFLVGFSRPNQLPLPVTPAAGGYSKSRDASGSALEDVFRSYPNLGSSGDTDSHYERNDHLLRQLSGGQRAWSPADSSDNEAESWSWAAGGGAGSSSRHPRHCRSLSVDSIMGNLKFEPPSPVAGAGGSLTLTRNGSGPSGGAVAAASSELTNGEFSEYEMKKIMANERLAEIALKDPKRVKRFETFWSSCERMQPP